ncbi:MAG: histidine ammonia-lyase [Gemmatimonadales bacterium]
MSQTIILDGQSLTIDLVHSVAVDGASVELSPTARKRMKATQKVVADIIEGGEAVYGVTTGFGKLSEIAIPKDRLAELQVNLVRSHAAGVGPLLPEREVRAMMLLRANVLAKGYSGARAELVDLILAMLNAGIQPPIHEQGSVGASGDLAPLAALGVAMIGEGMLCAKGGELRPAAQVLREHGLEPLTLGPKEGITLINGTQAHTAIAALALYDAQRLWLTAHVAGAMSLEALLGTPVPFDERIQEARGQIGQAASAAVLRELLEGSELRESHRYGDPRVQDAYCLRCMPQVHGPVKDALDWIEGIVTRELNAATDNPLVFENGETLSGGNFHGQAVGLTLDVLAIVMTNLATIAERRVDRLVHPDFNQGLPAMLANEAGVNSGFMMAQVTAAALASECKVLSHPATVDTIPTDGNREDVVPMSMGAAWKARRVIDNVRYVLAIELMCAAQGLDFRAPLKPGLKLIPVHESVRSLVPPLDRDRVLTADIQVLSSGIAMGMFTGGVNG